ncbi:MAG: pilus assembly protein [Candidatus Riflebacteria bacterium]|nr:pilus assembly protein [Candidatus Riflebacteria bacterium]
MRKKAKNGQAIVEMALVLPIFLLVLIGIFDFGRALHCWSTLNYQCVQAARAATKRINPLYTQKIFSETTHPSIEEVEAAFWKFRSPMMASDSYNAMVFSGIGTASQTVEVRAAFNLELITPLLGGLVGGENKPGAITIHATAKENKE